MSKVTDLGLITNKAKMVNPVSLLKEVLREYEDGEIDHKKLVTISLDTKHGAYSPYWNIAGMSHSEVIALLETVKVTLFYEMGFIGNPDE